MAVTLPRQSAVSGRSVVQFLPYAIILALALVLRHVIGGVTDVSWQITLSEKILDGQRLYIDLLEVNPPASTFLYLPAVAFAGLLHLSPELVIDLQTLLAACLSLFVAGRIFGRAPQRDVDSRIVGIVILAVLVLLPMRTFAQREHYALIAMLPLVAAAATHAAGVSLLRWQSVVAGLCGGIIVCIKPHFALAIVFAYAVAAIRVRSIRPLFAVENWIAVALVLIYAAIVVVFYRAFLTDMMPLLADLYLPARRPLTDPMLIGPVLLSVAAFATMIALDPRLLRSAPFGILFAASAGFAIAYLLQGKGWPYQALPMLGLTVIAFALALPALLAVASLKRLASIAAFIAVIACSAFWLQIGVDTRAVAAEVRRIAPQPSVVVISGDIAHGHPLVREVGGRWLSAVCGQWATSNAMALEQAGRIPAEAKSRIAAHVAADRARLIADIRDGKPDVILVHESGPVWAKWAAADTGVIALLANYTRIGTVDHITIYKRKT